MFEDLLFEKDQVIFKPSSHNLNSVYSYEEQPAIRWVNIDNNLMFFQENNKWFALSKDKHMNEKLEGQAFSTRKEILHAVTLFMEELKLDFDLNIKMIRYYQAFPSSEHILFESQNKQPTAALILSGCTKNWRWSAPSTEDFMQLYNLAEQTPNHKHVLKDYFDTKKEAYLSLWNIVNHNLAQLYYQHQNEYPFDLTHPISTKFWWAPFVKPEIDLSTIFN